MINLTLEQSSLLNRRAQAYAFFAEDGSDFSQFAETARELYPYFEQAARVRNFSGKAESFLILTGIHNEQPIYLILLGLGNLQNKEGNLETYRRALGRLVRIAESHKLSSITFDLPDAASFQVPLRRLAQETSTIMNKASYHFDEYITNKDRKVSWDINVFVGINQADVTEAQEGVKRGSALADAINTARYWCDLPPSALTPPAFAQYAQDIAKEYGLTAEIFNKEAIVKMGMGGIEGVARGSMHEPYLTILEYKAQKANAPTIALVGKGVTFDTGGLCLKPSQSMLCMKDDMAGAAVVLATMKVIATIKPNVNVVAVAPMVENMPSGTAVKPGDVLKTYNGKTIEVIDTDAEGRLILADALAYAVDKYKPDALIDVATLTGACAAALGVFYAGLFTQHDELAEALLKASQKSGDRLCRLPMDNDYKPAIKSEIADIQNIGSRKYMGGSITAAFFLQHFVGTAQWAHLDIAGTSFGTPDLTYLRPGATGFGIRLLVDLIIDWQQ